MALRRSILVTRLSRIVKNESLAAWANAISTAASVFVAILALFISIQALRENSRLMKDANKPDLRARWNISGVHGSSVELSLVNVGPGAAQVKWIRPSLSGKELGSWQNLFSTLGLNLEHDVAQHELVVELEAVGDGFVAVPPLATHTVFKLTSEIGQQKTIKNLVDASQRIALHICYCSVYSECWYRITGAVELLTPSCPELPTLPE